MIINGITLFSMQPIKDMLDHKVQASPTSYGLTECGYDIRLKEDILFDTEHRYAYIDEDPKPRVMIDGGYEKGGSTKEGRLVLGSSMEYFHVPNTLMGRVLNKSTWARKGLDASMTTNIEPGWRGHLTIELIYHGQGELHIPAGSGICQVVFERILNSAQYEGKYQDQEDRPVEARGLRLPDSLYLPPDQAFNHHKALWDSFDTAQQMKLIQDARAQGHETLPAWMVVRDDPRHPEYLANQHRLEEWHEEKKKKICSEDGCYRTENCGPHCRNRN